MRIGLLVVTTLLASLLLSACGTQQATGGAVGLTQTQQLVGERVAGAASTAYLLGQVTGPALSALQSAQARGSADEAPSLEELLGDALGHGAVQVDRQPGSLLYSVTVNHGSILAGLVPVNGTLTSSAVLWDPLSLSVSSEGLAVGKTSMSGAVALSLPATDPALAIIARDVRIAQEGQGSACEFDLDASVTPKALGAVTVDGTMIVAAEGLARGRDVEVAVVVDDLTARVASPHPTSGTITFVCEEQKLQVAFDGSRYATLSDGAGHWVAVPLPSLI